MTDDFQTGQGDATDSEPPSGGDGQAEKKQSGGPTEHGDATNPEPVSGGSATAKTIRSDAQPGFGDATSPAPATGGGPGPATARGATGTESTVLGQDTDDYTDTFIGAVIDNYQIVEKLGGGGFGDVYKAKDTKLDRMVALKFLRNPLDRKHQAMFAREAQAIAKLGKHPNIVEIHTWGSYANLNYFVLEYVQTDLNNALASSPSGMPLIRALRLSLQCADALAYAHEQGVIHRDIKPANILLEGDEGPAKIADFGLTRFIDNPDASISAGVSGSPPYMSPEQATGERVDHRSDIFSLGTMLYQLLAGVRPYEGKTALEVMEKIKANKRTPLKKKAPHVPETVCQIVEEAMAYAPENRYQTARALADDLAEALKAQDAEECEKTLSQFPARVRRTNPHRLAMAAVAVLAAGLLILALLTRPDSTGVNEDTDLRHARSLMDAGDATGAGSLYRTILDKDELNAMALYGMGYALLNQGNPDAALDAFSMLKDEASRNEGLAAVAYTREASPSSAEIQTAMLANPTDYARTLAGMAGLVAGKHQNALDTLRSVENGGLYFGWQQDEHARALGQAHYRLQDYDSANEIFAQLADSERTRNSELAQHYLDRIAQQQDVQRQQAVVALAQEVKKSFDADLPASTPEEQWTSRPIPFFLVPVETGASRYAVEEGVEDLLLSELGNELDDLAPMNLVERGDLMADVLTEQALTSLLNKEGQKHLGKFLGARLVIRPEFSAYKGDEWVRLHMVDTETGEMVLSDKVTLDDRPRVDDLAKTIAAEIVAGVRSEYRLQAKIERDGDKVRLSIGRNAGVMAGMQFALSTAPDTRYRVQDAVAVVDGEIDANWADVLLNGLTLGDVPTEGFYVYELPQEAPAPQ